MALAAAPLAFGCGLLPIVIVHLCYALSIRGGFTASCIPYIDGCVSISATGRQGWGYFLFKAGMLPAAVLIAAFWLLATRYLRVLGDSGPALRALVFLGIASAVFLALYTTFLGHKGDVYHLLRRFGVSLALGLGYLAQLLFAWRLAIAHRRGSGAVPIRLLRGLQTLLAVLLLLGLGSIPVSNFVADKDPIENAIEWTFCLLLWSLYLLTGYAWRRTGYRLTPELESSRVPGRSFAAFGNAGKD